MMDEDQYSAVRVDECDTTTCMSEKNNNVYQALLHHHNTPLLT